MNQFESPQVKALKDRYRASFVEKIATLNEQRNALAIDGDSQLTEAHESLHKLAGSSGMYGYEDVSLLCRKTMTKTDKADVVEGLDALIELLEQHRQA